MPLSDGAPRPLPLGVNADERIPARVLRAEIAHETGLRSNLDMARSWLRPLKYTSTEPIGAA